MLWSDLNQSNEAMKKDANAKNSVSLKEGGGFWSKRDPKTLQWNPIRRNQKEWQQGSLQALRVLPGKGNQKGSRSETRSRGRNKCREKENVGTERGETEKENPLKKKGGKRASPKKGDARK